MVINMTRSCKIYPSVWNLRTEFCFPAELNGCPKYFSWWAKILPSLYWIQLREGSEKASAKNCQKKLLRTTREKKKLSTMKSNILIWRASLIFFLKYLQRKWQLFTQTMRSLIISIFLKLASNKFHFAHITQITIFSRKNDKVS